MFLQMRGLLFLRRKICLFNYLLEKDRGSPPAFIGNELNRPADCLRISGSRLGSLRSRRHSGAAIERDDYSRAKILKSWQLICVLIDLHEKPVSGMLDDLRASQ